MSAIENHDQLVARVAELEAEVAESKADNDMLQNQKTSDDRQMVIYESLIEDQQFMVAKTQSGIGFIRIKVKKLEAQLAAQPTCEQVCEVVRGMLKTYDELSDEYPPDFYDGVTETVSAACLRITDLFATAGKLTTKAPTPT